MVGKPFRLCGDDLREFRLDRRCNVGVELLSLIAQKAAICRVSDERVLELALRFEYHRSQQGMPELAPNGRSDLCNLLGGAEPVEPRRQ